jgi:hypothetical protein
MSLLDKIRKSGMTPETTVEPMMDEMMPQMWDMQTSEPMMNPWEDEMFSEYEDEDMDAVIEYGPLWSIKELIFPLAAQATDRQIIEFVMDILAERKTMLDNL